MASFLFWNLAGNSPVEALVCLARHLDTDVLILAEWTGLDSERLLSDLGQEYRLLPVFLCQKVLLISRFADSCWTQVRDTQDMTLRALQLPGEPEILLAAMHLPSRLRNNSPANQAALCSSLAGSIVACENERRHTRTILVGDLNQNPYDPGLVHATALNAVMAKGIARQQTRVLRDGHAYRMFFNPMWHLFGDTIQQPPGSYYYRTNEIDCLFWHLFDQVLVRPDLIDVLDESALGIPIHYPLPSGEVVSLLSDAGIPRRAISDHLPLHFRLRIETASAVH
jgi:hypothetical protein